jgi:hypothetical protein
MNETMTHPGTTQPTAIFRAALVQTRIVCPASSCPASSASSVPTGPGLGIKVNEEAMRPLCRQGEFFADPTTYWDSQVSGEKAYP